MVASRILASTCRGNTRRHWRSTSLQVLDAISPGASWRHTSAWCRCSAIRQRRAPWREPCRQHRAGTGQRQSSRGSRQRGVTEQEPPSRLSRQRACLGACDCGHPAMVPTRLTITCASDSDLGTMRGPGKCPGPDRRYQPRSVRFQAGLEATAPRAAPRRMCGQVLNAVTSEAKRPKHRRSGCSQGHTSPPWRDDTRATIAGLSPASKSSTTFRG